MAPINPSRKKRAGKPVRKKSPPDKPLPSKPKPKPKPKRSVRLIPEFMRTIVIDRLEVAMASGRLRMGVYAYSELLSVLFPEDFDEPTRPTTNPLPRPGSDEWREEVERRRNRQPVREPIPPQFGWPEEDVEDDD